jgi:hypothetical protein
MAQRDRSDLDDDDFLNIVLSELRQSVGFEFDKELMTEREQALQYYKGEMTDMPALQNRSAAVSTDVSDAIETVLPDLMEIFTGGDDVVTFKPISANDEEQAADETEYVRQVVFGENEGFLALYSGFKDALQLKVGVWKVWWEDEPIEPEDFEGKSGVEVIVLAHEGKVDDIEQDGVDEETGQPTYSLTLTDEDPGGRVKIMAVPAEDFTVGRDTVRLTDATYCAFRSRPRVQQLIEQGFDPALCEELTPYGYSTDQNVMLARDDAGEHLEQINVVGNWNLRTVEIVEHYVRVDANGDGKPELWRVVTGGSMTSAVLLLRERVDRLPFTAVTPYPIPHRFYGRSVSDLLMEVQRIKTALLRMMLDSGYFALNQRMEVSDKGVNEYTLGDLMRLEPGFPVRVRESGSVTPIQAGQLNFEVFQALEYVSTIGEQRTGIVRNAQGLAPDTLHDTAQGMTQLMQNAQMRLRLVARVFAETGVKDLFLLVHSLLRKHGHESESMLGGQWKPVNCSEWAERKLMRVDVGLGSAGRAQELLAMQQVIGYQNEIVKLQGGANGPLVTLPNIYAALIRYGQKAGQMGVSEFFSDPANAPPQQPQPNPEMVKAQGEQQLKAQELAQKGQTEQARMQLDAAEIAAKHQRELLALKMADERERQRIASEQAMKAAELEVRRADVINRLDVERAKLAVQVEVAELGAGVQLSTVQAKSMAEGARATVDLAMQERAHEHEEDIEHVRAAAVPGGEDA